jgi:hypothetical protein
MTQDEAPMICVKCGEKIFGIPSIFFDKDPTGPYCNYCTIEIVENDL